MKLITNDLIVDAIFKKLQILPEEIKEVEASVFSNKVSGIKALE
jgi:hypothetical protein